VDGYLLPALDTEQPWNVAVTSLSGGVTLEREGEPVVPVEVAVVLYDGQERLIEWEGDTSSVLLEIEGGGMVREAVVDPQGKLLIDSSRLDNGMSRDTTTGGPRPFTLASVGAIAVQVLLSMVMP
jgi:hypothetical protein